MSTPSPRWAAGNLTKHHGKRLRKDAGCFEALLSITGRTMREDEYEQRSEKVVAASWAEYEGQGRDVEAQRYYDPAAYFVDDDLVIAITDTFRRQFITCFHEHFGRKHARAAVIATAGQRQLRYREHLKFEEQGRLIINVKRIRGV